MAVVGLTVAEIRIVWVINDWALERDRFWQVVPKEMLGRLAQPLSDRVEEERA